MFSLKGGWMMLANVTVKTDQIPNLTYGDYHSFAQLQQGNFLLHQNQIKTIHEHILPIKEFRLFCHRPSHGRTISIKTSQTARGKEIRDAMALGKPLPQRDTTDNPTAFKRLPDDTSLLSRRNDLLLTFPTFPNVAYDHMIYTKNVANTPRQYFLIRPEANRYECDDERPPLTDCTFLVFVR